MARLRGLNDSEARTTGLGGAHEAPRVHHGAGCRVSLAAHRAGSGAVKASPHWVSQSAAGAVLAVFANLYRGPSGTGLRRGPEHHDRVAHDSGSRATPAL